MGWAWLALLLVAISSGSIRWQILQTVASETGARSGPRALLGRGVSQHDGEAYVAAMRRACPHSARAAGWARVHLWIDASTHIQLKAGLGLLVAMQIAQFANTLLGT